jgi:hypothetical protein
MNMARVNWAVRVLGGAVAGVTKKRSPTAVKSDNEYFRRCDSEKISGIH